MARESTIQVLYGNAATTAPGDLSDGEFAFAHGNDKLFIGTNGDNTAVWVGAEILDEDTFSSDSDTSLATQQSIKAYVDSAIGASAGVVSIEGLNGAIDLDANTGITLSTSGGDTITFSGTDATTSAKGVASFTSDDFSVSSGAVSLGDDVVKDITTDSGALTPSGHAFSILGGEGMDVTHTGTTITVAGEDASDTNKGIASFAAADFDITTGAVSLEDTVVKTVTTDSGALTPSSHGFSIVGGEGMDVTHTSTTITVAGEDASTTNKGVALFSSDNFDVSSGTVTIKDGGVANAELANSSVTVTAGSGLSGGGAVSLGGTVVVDVSVDDSTIEIVTDSLQLKDGGVTNAKLENSSFTISDGTNTSPVDLGGTLTLNGTTNEVTVTEDAGTVTIGLPDDVTIAGNLTVNGSVTTVDTTNLVIEDPLILLAKNNNSTDSLDIGFYGLYDTSGSQDLYAGIFRDASDSGKFKLFETLQVAPTTTVDTGGTGYAVATLVANINGGTY